MLEDSVESVLVLPAGSADEAFRDVRQFLDAADAYELEAVEEDSAGALYRVYAFAGDHLFSVRFEEGPSDYPDGTLVQVRYTVGPTLEETSDADGVEPIETVADATRDLYGALDAFPRAGFGVETYQDQTAPISADDLPPTDRRFLTWIDVFPPAEVEAVGRDRLLSAPAASVQDLDDGGVLLVSKHPVTTDPRPLDAVADHVGIRPWEDYPHERASAEDFEE